MGTTTRTLLTTTARTGVAAATVLLVSGLLTACSDNET